MVLQGLAIAAQDSDHVPSPCGSPHPCAGRNPRRWLRLPVAPLNIRDRGALENLRRRQTHVRRHRAGTDHAAGIEGGWLRPYVNPNVTVLDYTIVMSKFAPVAVRDEYLEPGIRE